MSIKKPCGTPGLPAWRAGRIIRSLMVNPSVFRAYDIRGLAPEEIDTTFARRLGKALVAQNQPKRVIVGHDMRVTSAALEEALIEGLTASGVSVTRIGLCTTPIFFFAVAETKGAYDLGIMVTASHNPSAYNGFKIVDGSASPLDADDGMSDLRDLMISDEALPDSATRGAVDDDPAALDRYLDRVFTLSELPPKLPGWRIAVDTGNGMNGIVMPKFFKRLPSIEAVQLFWDLDGTFPNHDANPTDRTTLTTLKNSVVRDMCAFGVAFDGDADRIAFVDEEGEPVPGDLLVALLAQERLTHGAAPIVYDVRSSWSVAETIRAGGGMPVIWHAGSTKIKRKMREVNAAFGGEATGHLFFPELNGQESGERALLLILSLLLRTGLPLSRLWKPLVRYFTSGEINFPTTKTDEIINTIAQTYAASATYQLDVDGIRREFCDASNPEQDWWFNLRASNTEPLLRLNIEARSPEVLREKKKDLSDMISRISRNASS